jgi:hypothetical protein
MAPNAIRYRFIIDLPALEPPHENPSSDYLPSIATKFAREMAQADG